MRKGSSFYLNNIQRVLRVAKRKNIPLDQIHLRIAVQSGGCSGLQYKFSMDYDKLYEYDKYLDFWNNDS